DLPRTTGVQDLCAHGVHPDAGRTRDVRPRRSRVPPRPGNGPRLAPPAAGRARRAPRPRVLGLCLLRRQRVPPGRTGLPAGAVLGTDDAGRAPPDGAPPYGHVKRETNPVSGRVLLVGAYVTHAHNHSVGED